MTNDLLERFPFTRLVLRTSERFEDFFEVCSTCGATIYVDLVHSPSTHESVNPLELHHQWHLRRNE